MGAVRAGVGFAAAMVLVLAGCSSSPPTEAGAPTPTPSSPVTSAGDPAPDHDAHQGGSAEAATVAGPLRAGERYVEVGLPRAYTPGAPTTGTDDYRCFLLDPGLDQDAYLTGLDVLPGRDDLVHHVILFRVPPDAVTRARLQDRSVPGQGWTCFGGSGLEGPDDGLDDAPWLGAWAPGGGEQALAPDLGIPLEAGSLVVLQVHYNLISGTGADRSRARLRIAPGTKGLQPLETMLLPAPVELPCRPGADGPLCDRAAALADVKTRFGAFAGATADFLSMICQGNEPGPVQSCSRSVGEPATIRAVAGHMHLLGRSLSIVVNPDSADAHTVLDIPVWDFDDQASRPLDRPVRLEPGDELQVTCEHDQGLRDLLPAFEDQPERYVLWGEGTTDEMCLGIVLVTRP